MQKHSGRGLLGPLRADQSGKTGLSQEGPLKEMGLKMKCLDSLRKITYFLTLKQVNTQNKLSKEYNSSDK